MAEGVIEASELTFTSLGCNCISNCIDWNTQNDLLAYGGSNFIGLYDVKGKKLLFTLRGHKGRVNAVKFFGKNELVSISSDGKIIFWKINEKNQENRYQLLSQQSVHKKSVTSLSVLEYPGEKGETLIVTTSADKTVAVLKRDNYDSEWVVVQHGVLAGEAVECCGLWFLPSSPSNPSPLPLLALGGVGGEGSCRGSQILLFIPSFTDDGKFTFVKVLTLKGHEDWVRCLAFVTNDQGKVLLASASQDRYIRLWLIEELTDRAANSEDSDDSKHSDFLKSLSSFTQLRKNDNTSLSQQSSIFSVTIKDERKQYIVSLDAVLIGHEDWVYSVSWQKPIRKEDGSTTQPMSLLSASMDKTMMIWRPKEEEGGVWINEVRVGELGGNTLGFYGCSFSPDGSSIIAHGYNGAFHLWNQTFSDSGDNIVHDGDRQEIWVPDVTISGHFGPIQDVQWSPSGLYYISVSHDQTARIFSQWSATSSSHWFEISRPQIHGYNLECVTFLPHRHHQFVSGAEEKIFRVFDAPMSFVHNLHHITGVEMTEGEDFERPLGANIPTLGLSNKPVFSNTTQVEEETIQVVDEDGTSFSMDSKPAEPVFITRPPYEEELIQSTLWPEIQKLYGHGNYTYCVSSNRSGSLIATAVRAKSDPAQSAIRLWDTSSWKEVGLLYSHKHTVTQLSFSRDDRYLLSASRDRQFTIFQRVEDGDKWEYKIAFKQPEAHSRIIWACDWSHDSLIFATGSRDKTVTIWKLVEGEDGTLTAKSLSSIQTKVVTALSFAPHFVEVGGKSYYMLAVGFEEGTIEIWHGELTDSSFQWSTPHTLNSNDCHSLTVRKIDWRPNHKDLQIVSGSLDQSSRIYSLRIKS